MAQQGQWLSKVNGSARSMAQQGQWLSKVNGPARSWLSKVNGPARPMAQLSKATRSSSIVGNAPSYTYRSAIGRRKLFDLTIGFPNDRLVRATS
jgi:hypothetical protein